MKRPKPLVHPNRVRHSAIKQKNARQRTKCKSLDSSFCTVVSGNWNNRSLITDYCLLRPDVFFLWRYSPNLGLGLPPWNSPFQFGFLDLRQSVGLLGRVISSSQGLSTCTQTQKNAHTQTLHIHALSGILTHDPGFRASEDSACLRPLAYRDRHWGLITYLNEGIRDYCLTINLSRMRKIIRCNKRKHFYKLKTVRSIKLIRTERPIRNDRISECEITVLWTSWVNMSYYSVLSTTVVLELIIYKPTSVPLNTAIISSSHYLKFIKSSWQFYKPPAGILWPHCYSDVL
jgi:hypothetical protein